MSNLQAIKNAIDESIPLLKQNMADDIAMLTTYSQANLYGSAMEPILKNLSENGKRLEVYKRVEQVLLEGQATSASGQVTTMHLLDALGQLSFSTSSDALGRILFLLASRD